MEYRPIKKEERVQLTELQAMSFFFKVNRKTLEEQMEKDDMSWRSGWAAVDEGGKILSGMELIPFDVWFDGQSVGMGGIGGVCSRLEERRGGHIRKLFEGIMKEMYDRDYVFSYLYPFSHEYYRKFGYELSNTSLTIKAPVLPLLNYSEPGHGEMFLPGEGGSDPGPIVEIYNDFAEHHNLMIDRAGWRWRGVLEHDPINEKRRTYVWYDEAGEPAAYFILVKPEDAKSDELTIQEAAWRSPKGMRGLLGFIGRFGGNMKKLTWTLPQSITPELIWPEPWEVEAERKFTGMNRVVNVLEALKRIRKPAGSGSVRISVTDEFFPANTGVYKVDWTDGEGTARRARSATADMECSVHAMAQLTVGFQPFEVTALRRDIQINSKADELERLFPKKALYLPDYF